jgi:hypothetical protein
MQVVFTHIEGPVMVWLAPPPSKNLWLSFLQPPKIKVSAKPLNVNAMVQYTAMVRLRPGLLDDASWASYAATTCLRRAQLPCCIPMHVARRLAACTCTSHMHMHVPVTSQLLHCAGCQADGMARGQAQAVPHQEYGLSSMYRHQDGLPAGPGRSCDLVDAVESADSAHGAHIISCAARVPHDAISISHLWGFRTLSSRVQHSTGTGCRRFGRPLGTGMVTPTALLQPHWSASSRLTFGGAQHMQQRRRGVVQVERDRNRRSQRGNKKPDKQANKQMDKAAKSADGGPLGEAAAATAAVALATRAGPDGQVAQMAATRRPFVRVFTHAIPRLLRRGGAQTNAAALGAAPPPSTLSAPSVLPSASAPALPSPQADDAMDSRTMTRLLSSRRSTLEASSAPSEAGSAPAALAAGAAAVRADERLGLPRAAGSADSAEQGGSRSPSMHTLSAGPSMESMADAASADAEPSEGSSLPALPSAAGAVAHAASSDGDSTPQSSDMLAEERTGDGAAATLDCAAVSPFLQTTPPTASGCAGTLDVPATAHTPSPPHCASLWPAAAPANAAAQDLHSAPGTREAAGQGACSRTSSGAPAGLRDVLNDGAAQEPVESLICKFEHTPRRKDSGRQPCSPQRRSAGDAGAEAPQLQPSTSPARTASPPHTRESTDGSAQPGELMRGLSLVSARSVSGAGAVGSERSAPALHNGSPGSECHTDARSTVSLPCDLDGSELLHAHSEQAALLQLHKLGKKSKKLKQGSYVFADDGTVLRSKRPAR